MEEPQALHRLFGMRKRVVPIDKVEDHPQIGHFTDPPRSVWGLRDRGSKTAQSLANCLLL